MWILITARSELRKVLFLVPSVCGLCLCMRYLGNLWMDLRQIHTEDVSLFRRSVEFEGQGQRSRSPGTKRHFSALSATCVRFVFIKTSLASSSHFFEVLRGPASVLGRYILRYLCVYGHLLSSLYVFLQFWLSSFDYLVGVFGFASTLTVAVITFVDAVFVALCRRVDIESNAGRRAPSFALSGAEFSYLLRWFSDELRPWA